LLEQFFSIHEKKQACDHLQRNKQESCDLRGCPVIVTTGHKVHLHLSIQEFHLQADPSVVCALHSSTETYGLKPMSLIAKDES